MDRPLCPATFRAAKKLKDSHPLSPETQDHPHGDTPSAWQAARSEAGCFHTNVGFVPRPAGPGQSPKATTLLDVNRKTRGSLNLTPFPTKTFPPMGFQPTPQDTPDVEERGLGFWEMSPPWRSYATLGDGPLASGALLSAGLGLGQCEGLTLSSAHAPLPQPQPATANTAASGVALPLFPMQGPCASLPVGSRPSPMFWSLEHCLSDAFSCCCCFLSVLTLGELLESGAWGILVHTVPSVPRAMPAHSRCTLNRWPR